MATTAHLLHSGNGAPHVSLRRRFFASIKGLTSFGFLARGVLYLLFAAAVIVSLLHHRKPREEELDQTFHLMSLTRPGTLLLAGLALGFMGFGIGMSVVALLDLNRDGWNMKGIARRTGYLAAGIAHLGLTASVALVLLGHQPAHHPARQWAARAMSYPVGGLGIMAAGLWAMGYAIFLAYKGWTARLDPHLELHRVGRFEAFGARLLGRIGFLTRAVLYLTVGAYLARAGWRGDPRTVIGVGGALRTLGNSRYGPFTMGIVAFGLGSYGVFLIVQARFRRMCAEDAELNRAGKLKPAS